VSRTRLLILFMLLFGIFMLGSIYKYHIYPKEIVLTIDEVMDLSNIKTFDNYIFINNTKVNLTNYHDLIKRYQDYYHNTDIIAHLKIPGTDIDTPVVLGHDNSYYLRHNLERKYSRYGTPFVDYRNDINDRQINIYGHNSSLIKMVFYDLTKYLNEDFYKENSLIELIISDEKRIYEIFSVYLEKQNLSHYEHMNLDFDDESWLNHLDTLQNKSIYKNYTKFNVENQIMVLQTCLKTQNVKKIMLICAKRVE